MPKRQMAPPTNSIHKDSGEFSLWSRLWEIIRPYAPRVVMALIFGLIVSGINGAVAWLVKPAMDHIIIKENFSSYLLLPIAVFVLYALRGGADMIQAYLMRTAGFKLVRDLRNLYFENLTYLPVATVARSSSGDIVSRLMNDISQLSNILSETFRTSLVQIPSVLVLMGVALYRKWDLALLSFVLLPLIAYGTKILSKFVRSKRREVQRYMGLLTHRMTELVTGLKVIKIFGMESVKIQQFQKESHLTYRHNAKLVRLKEVTSYFTEILSGLAVAVILGYGGYLIRAGAMTSGDFFSVLTAVVMAFAPLKKLGSSYASFQESLGVLDRVDEFLKQQPEPGSGQPVAGLREGLRFERVGFTYPGAQTPAIMDLDLDVPQGKIVALVGPSGAGKSTLADLIPRFLSPDQGRILWDGQPLDALDLRDLRRHIAVVSQDIILFSDTIRENIVSGKTDVPDDDIVRAAQMAQAHEFIEALPEGYATVLDERGLNLSGGQRQRIALARAVLKDPALLILDEATSALDAVSEMAVQQALASVMKDRTTLVIAHRLSTIQNADQIAVMDHGRIVAIGTHDDLLERDPLYRELYQTWRSETPDAVHASGYGR